MQPVGDLLGDQGGVAADAVVDNQVHLDLAFYRLVHDLNEILDHLRVEHKSVNFPLPPLPHTTFALRRCGGESCGSF